LPSLFQNPDRVFRAKWTDFARKARHLLPFGAIPPVEIALQQPALAFAEIT
jgi:hypothetical protein